MKPEYVTKSAVQSFISSAFREDLGDGDHSTKSSVPETALGEAQLVSKDNGIIAGLELAQEVFDFFDPELQLTFFKKDGDIVSYGDVIYTITGKAQSILTTERLVLNCIQRMSGIASKTHKMVELISHTKAELLDTRKTTPNFRMLEKWAVKIGGGTNHRFGLFDLIMLKDNHINFAGGIEPAIRSAQDYIKKYNRNLKIEIETCSLNQVKEVLKIGGVDIVMLDNMSPELMKSCVSIINGRFLIEASGGITEETVREVAETGVDHISIGALTHSYKSLDLSLKAIQ